MLAKAVLARLHGAGSGPPAAVSDEPLRLAAPVIMAQAVKAEAASIEAKTQLFMDNKGVRWGQLLLLGTLRR